MANLTDRQKVGHLLRRFGLGAGMPDMEIYAPLGPEKAMQKLVTFDSTPDLVDPMRFAYREEGDADPGPWRFRIQWMCEMIRTKNPLREKMAVFWHDHFAVRMADVENGLAILEYQKRLREDPIGKFRDILDRMVKSPGVMMQLNLELFSKARPNENFARELLELYTLGEGNYAEKDILEIAKALTGWGYVLAYWQLGSTNDERLNMMRKFDVKPIFSVYGEDAHIKGPKQVLGKTVDTLDDVLDMLAKHPQTARYVSTKLWEYFGYKNPERQVVDRLAKKFLDTDGSIKDVLVEMTKMSEFWSDKCVRGLIKNPIDFYISICRAQNSAGELEKRLDAKGAVDKPLTNDVWSPLGSLNYYLTNAGMEIYQPPSVAGWDWHEGWISANNMLRRQQYTGMFVYYKSQRDGKDVWLPDVGMKYILGEIRKRSADTLDGLINAFLTVYDCPLPEKKIEVLREHFKKHGMPQNVKNDESVAWAVNQGLKLLAGTPEFNLH
ncbi:MAG: DUF1800 family protein [Armatimonadetes bacterium]|nr:DUF1800 family protein [Armatimonadota bacterium]